MGRRAAFLNVPALLLGVLLIAMIASSPSTGKARTDGPRCPNGMILQLRTVDAARGEAHWRLVLDQLQAASVSALFIQWSVHEQTAFLPVSLGSGFKSVETPPLPLLLQLADERRIQVWIGLIEDPAYWKAIAADAATAAQYLQRLRQRTSRLLADLRPLVAGQRSFAGWYIPQEVDDVNWRAPAARQVLIDHLRTLSADVRRGHPDARLAISGFSNASMDPESLASFWALVMEKADIDVLLFQDGIGVAKLELGELRPYLSALQGAITRTGRSLRVVVEAFTQTTRQSSDGAAFAAVPAPFDRVRQQIDVAMQHSDEPPVIFGTDYMAPVAGEQAAELFRSYTAWLASSASCK